MISEHDRLELAEEFAGILADREMTEADKVEALVREVEGLIAGVSAVELQGARLGHVTYESGEASIQHDASGNFVRLDVAAPVVVEFYPRQE